MKKILALVITAAMLFTCLFALPVLAETEEINLIVNGSFEEANESVTIGNQVTFDGPGWTQTNEAAKYAWRTEQSPYLFPEGTYMIHDGGVANAGLKQTVELDAEAAWVTDYANYRYDLSFTGYGRDTNSARGSIVVTAYAADGTSVSRTFTGGRDFCTSHPGNTMFEDTTLDLTDVIEELGAAAVKFDIELKSNANGDMGWDNIRLTPVYAEGNVNTNRPIDIPFVNPSFELDETGTTTGNGGTITGWTTSDAEAGWEIVESNGADLIPSDGTKMLVARGGANADTGITQKGRPIKQTIEIPADADYFGYMSEYTWTLDVTTYYILICDITAYNYDRSISATTRYTSFDGRTWTTYNWSWDISEALSKVGKAKYIEFSFMANSDSQPTVLENLKLTCLKQQPQGDDDTSSLITNGGFETKNEDGTLAGWEAFYPADYNVYEFVYDAARSPVGFGSVKLTSATIESTDGQGNPVSNIYGGYISQMIPVEAGKYYKIQFTYQASADNSAFAEVTDKDDGTKLYSETFARSGGGFITASQLFKATQTKEVEFALRCYPGTSGVMYENVSVTEHEVDESALTERGNLLVNGSFEQDVAGALGFIGWDVEGVPTKVSTTVEDARARDGSKVMYHGYDIVSQTVEITEHDRVNSANYGYKLDFSYGSYSGGAQGVSFDLVFEDESQNITYTFEPIRINADTGLDGNGNEPDLTVGFPHVVGASTPADVSIDISFLTQSTTSPLKSITIRLPNVGTVCWLDDFSLYAVNKNDVAVLDADGNYVEKITTNQAATYVAAVDYYGADENAKVYLAVYEKDNDDNLRLVKIAVATIVEGAVDLRLENINAVAGSTIVKAYLWHPGLKGITTTVIE